MFLKTRRQSNWGSSRWGRQSSWLSNNRKRRSIHWGWMVAAVPLLLIGVEGLTRVGVGLAGKTKELGAYQGEAPLTTAYRLRFVDRSGKTYDSLPDRGALVARHNPLLGYTLAPGQTNEHWQINAQGLRDTEAIASEKPNDEIRILVLGGSTAFGQLSSSNATTFSEQLEQRLNHQVNTQKTNPEQFRPDKLSYFADEQAKQLARTPRIREGQYRVINAAIPGYASGNDLAQLVQRGLGYQPDLVIVMNGYADLVLPSDHAGADVPKLESRLDDSAEAIAAAVGERGRSLLHSFYLIKAVQYWIQKPQHQFQPLIQPSVEAISPLAAMVTTNEGELAQRVERYHHNLTQITRLTQQQNIPLIVILQPEITGRTAASAPETAIAKQLPKVYRSGMETGYRVLGAMLERFKKEYGKTTTVLNLHQFIGDRSGNLLVDPIHLSDEGHTLVANKLYELITPRLQIQPNPFNAATATTAKTQ